MKKITLLLTTLITFTLSAQTNLFEDDFESYTDFAISGVGSWTLIDVDGLPTYGFTGVSFPESGSAKSFQVFNSTATTDPLTPSATSNWEGYNSTKGMVCFAAVPAAGAGNDDWLISPQVTLAESGNSISFWYKGCDANFSNEMFTVGISNTDTMPGSFTIISANPETVPAGDITWRQFTANIPATYDSASVYIGINCISNDQFGFMVDDFSVDTALLSVDEFGNTEFVHIACKDKIVTLSRMKGKATYRIFSMSGNQVFTGETRLESQDISLNNLASGVYIVEVSDAISGAVKRKKVVLN